MIKFSKKYQPALLSIGKLLSAFSIALILFVLVNSCTNKMPLNKVDRELWQSLEVKVVSKSFSMDSLMVLHQKYVKQSNYTGIYITSRELGNRYRVLSDFSKALSFHRLALSAAVELDDTISMSQAYNNIGTDLRRIGLLPEAANNHFTALSLSESYGDVSDNLNRKNHVISLNGLGNIALSLNFYDEAEEFFRKALRDEIMLDSGLGQAINHANIGAIFQQKKMYDSAFYYYEKSMEFNQMIGSKLGIALCHKHIGNIYEQKSKFIDAEKEYLISYDLLSELDDKWHWLEACLAVARINLKKNHVDHAEEYLQQAKQIAEQIKSPEHMSEVYALYEMYYSQRGQYKEALENNKLSAIYTDSVSSVQMSNQTINMRLDYERGKSQKQISKLNEEKEAQIRQKRLVFLGSILVTILSFTLLGILYYGYRMRTKSNRTLKRLDKARSDFFTNVTHEFRTPLTIILGHSRQLQESNNISSSESKRFLSNIEKQGNQMLKLVNQMLDMAKLSARVDHPKWKSGDVIVFVKMIVEMFRSYAEDKKVELSFISEERSITMDFVPNYIETICQNLISNAIKYTPEGGKVAVSLSLRQDNKLVLKVIDDGIGISNKEIEQIFEVFYRSENVSHTEGSGLGLAHTRRLAHRMGGEVTVKSKLNQGSVFTLILPTKQASPIENVEPWVPETAEPSMVSLIMEGDSTRDTSPDFTIDDESAIGDVRSTILVVEDNKDIIYYIDAILKDKYRIVVAFDGVEGIEKALKEMPDLILSDVMMPRKDGFALCQEVKSSPILNHIPIILLTAKTSHDDKLGGLKCGANAYIEKPFKEEELKITIKNLLDAAAIMKDKYMRAVFRDTSKEPVDANMDFLQKVTDLIYRKIDSEEMTPGYLAEELCITITQLNRKINNISGLSTSAYILNVRVEHAKKLLAKNALSVTEVAQACGFLDVSYFSRTFKKYTGVTPSQYRNLPR